MVGALGGLALGRACAGKQALHKKQAPPDLSTRAAATARSQEGRWPFCLAQDQPAAECSARREGEAHSNSPAAVGLGLGRCCTGAGQTQAQRQEQQRAGGLGAVQQAVWIKARRAARRNHLLIVLQCFAGVHVKHQVCVLCGKFKVNLRLIFSKLLLAHILFDEMSHLMFSS